MSTAAGIIIGNALVWGFVVVGCSLALSGTGHFQDIQHLLGGGAAVSLAIVSLTAVNRKHKQSE